MRGWLLAGLATCALPALAGQQTERLFQQCARSLSAMRNDATLRCQYYLQYAGDTDESRRARVQAYLNRNGKAGHPGWDPAPTPWRHRAEDDAVLVPDLLRRDGAHQVTVVRTYGSAWEGALLRRAEALYPAGPRGSCTYDDWSCGVMREEMRLAGVASPAALQYYLDWSMAGAAGKQAAKFAKSNLIYLAGISYRDRFQIGKHSFERVYVAEVDLGWTVHPSERNETGLMVHKVVVFSGEGTVLRMFNDHPLNAVVWDTWSD